MTRQLITPRNAVFAALVVALILLPQFSTSFFTNFVMTQTLILGVAASTIVFLVKYGGMVSLAQLLLFGLAGFAFGNIALDDAARGLNLGWNPWLAVLVAILVTTAVAFLLGAIASRTTGIYYLMLTLVYGVIGYFVFAQIVEISGPGGITSIDRPDLMGPPVRLYYGALLLSVVAYLGFRMVGRTAFGLALQGIRDDPIRMASLGFNVPLHRALAFTLGGLVAAPAGLLNVWWNGQIDPASIAIGPLLILLIIAVIGGISYFEGAWVGAFVYVLVFTYLRDLPYIDQIGITEARFNTVIGAVVLLIMVLSPEGLVGIIERLRGRAPYPGSPKAPPVSKGGAESSATTHENGTGLEVHSEDAHKTSPGDAPSVHDRSVRPGSSGVQ